MLVPFGTHVLDRDGRSVGTVSRLVLHRTSREVVALVVARGLLNRQELVVPLGKVARVGDDVRLTMRASELAGLDRFDEPRLEPMPDHWPMPVGFDLRSFFLVGGDGWTESILPFEMTSPEVSGTPPIPDPDAPERTREPAIAAGTPVYDTIGARIGEVDGVAIDDACGRLTRVTMRRGRFFGAEVGLPAGVIASIADDRITLAITDDEVKTLERRAEDLKRAS